MIRLSMRAWAPLAALVLTGCATLQGRSNPSPTAQVIVIPSMHGFHKDHPSYDYEALYQCVRNVHPDLVGVELREEDIAAGDTYLSQSYPREMIALRNEHRAHVFGFDWLGEQIAGRLIPPNWWQELSTVKRLEREMAKDQSMASKQDDALSEQQAEVLKNTTPALLADGRYDRLVRARRAILRGQAGSGHYAPIVTFTADRERHIGDNIVSTVRSHPGQTIVLVMGADHHGFAVERLRNEFGRSIRLEAVPAC